MNTKTHYYVSDNEFTTVVTDGRTLRGMSKANKLTWPVPVHGSIKHKYVDEGNRSRGFTFKGCAYRIKYVDGCFFPFVFKQGC